MTNFFGAVWENAGARPRARIPASPLAAPLSRRRRLGTPEVTRMRLIGRPPDVLDDIAPLYQPHRGEQ